MAWPRRKPPTATLVCPGVFAVDVPDGWSATTLRPAESFEITPGTGGPDVAVTISVFPLTDALAERGTVEMVRWLATVGADEVTGFSATTAPSSSGERAFGRWNSGGRTWFGTALFVNGFLVMGSSNSEYGDSGAYRLGEQLVAAIRPL